MTEGQKAFWLTAGFVVVAAISGVTLWQVATSPTGQIEAQLQSINAKLAANAAKIDKTSAALGEAQDSTASTVIIKGIAALEGKIKATDDAIAGLQKQIPAGDVGKRLDALDASVKSIGTAVADLQKSAAAGATGGKLDALASNVKAIGDALGDLKKTAAAAPAASAQPASAAVAVDLAPLDAKLTSISAALADLKKSGSGDATKMAAAGSGDLQAAVGDLKKGIADTAALRGQLSGDIAKLQAALKPQPQDVMVVYLHMPNAGNLPKEVAPVAPLDVEYAKIGSTDDNGQAAMIIPKLKSIVEGRKGCTISVAGYADTLGSDKANLKISQQRARNIAQKIKSAFAGTDVQVNEAAWGERRLKDWTPDNTAQLVNRRVDIAVNCKE